MTGHACSCGDAHPHVVARRRTADGIGVCIWDDGAVTGSLGMALPGVAIVRPRSDEARERERRAAWMLATVVELYDVDEVGALYDRCRRAAKRGCTLADIDAAAPRLPISWTTIRADRDGRPVARIGRLPRLVWPDLVIWDEHCGRGGRYEVVRRVRGTEDVYEPTGFVAKTLRELAPILDALRGVHA